MAVAKTNLVAQRLASLVANARQRYRRFRQRLPVWIVLMPTLPFHYYFIFLLNTEHMALEALSQDSESPPKSSKLTRFIVSLLIKAKRWQFFASGWEIADEEFAHSIERYYRSVYAVLIVLMIVVEFAVSFVAWGIFIQWVSERAALPLFA